MRRTDLSRLAIAPLAALFLALVAGPFARAAETQAPAPPAPPPPPGRLVDRTS